MKTSLTRSFLALEIFIFYLAALFHFGVLTVGFEHQKAGIAETVIGSVLLLALILSWVKPERTYKLGMAAQAFALLGVFVGIVMITIGIGPRTVPDVLIHGIMVFILLLGLVTVRLGP